MAENQPSNLMLPGNPRYQPEELKPFLGYDKLYWGLAEVEIAALDVLYDIGVIPPADYIHLTDMARDGLRAITTTAVDEEERKTRHDVRAWVRLAQTILHPDIGRWVHVPMTSYDPLDTGRSWLYQKAHNEAIRPALRETIGLFAARTRELADQVQIGRTHGQHALPITDAYVILAAVIFNVIVGFFQEYKAANALAALKAVIAQEVYVVRAGVEQLIDARELVVGDIVLLSPGSKVPADGRLFAAEYLKINEAAITGESEAAEKIHHSIEKALILADQHNMVFSGTIATEGRGRFFVTATGIDTEIGKIAQIVKDTAEVKTPLQLKLNSFGRKLGLMVLVLSLIVLGVGTYFGHNFVEMFTTAVAVAVAAIPEGLIIVVTIVLAIGMQHILKKGSLVRKLVAAETLGSTSVICVDKTGTLTLGEMRVVRLFTHSHDIDTVVNKHSLQAIQKGQWELRFLHRIAVNCSNAVIGALEESPGAHQAELAPEMIVGTPTEKALLLSAIESGFSEKDAMSERPRFDEVPFSSAKKFMATLNRWTDKQNIIYFKGAPEKIIAMCGHYQNGRTTHSLDAAKRKELIKQFEKLSKSGLRVLAGAYKAVGIERTDFADMSDYSENLVFVGFWGLKDPLRAEAAATIKETQGASVRTIMITGDNRHTALAIAKELGLNPKDGEIIDGSELAGLSARELARVVKKVKVFSRTTPEDKLRIVEALQANGEVVAMTGDGVNDAPALQKADIGVALGSGTDVAKETADLVLLDNNFSTIVAAVREGRVIFDNIRKITLYLLANSFTEMALVVIGILLGWPLPLLAAQILWINLVTDSLPNLALTQEPEEPEIMSEPPAGRDLPILDFERKFLIVFISTITTGVTLGLFYLVWKESGDINKARTVAFTAVAVESLLYVFSVRSLRRTIFETKHFSNPWLLWAVGGGFLIQLAGIYLPFFQKFLRTSALGWAEWLLILVASLWVIILIELAKYLFIIKRREAVSN